MLTAATNDPENIRHPRRLHWTDYKSRASFTDGGLRGLFTLGHRPDRIGVGSDWSAAVVVYLYPAAQSSQLSSDLASPLSSPCGKWYAAWSAAQHTVHHFADVLLRRAPPRKFHRPTTWTSRVASLSQANSIAPGSMPPVRSHMARHLVASGLANSPHHHPVKKDGAEGHPLS